MKVTDLPIPEPLKKSYTTKGIEALYPPQEEAVRRGIFEGKNLLCAIPTASGKTIVAEMAMHRQVADGGKCLYIVPLRALATEKYDDFSGKGLSVGVATGDLDRRDAYLGRNDIVVATSEKVDSLLRNRAPWLAEITLLVVDECHLIGSEDRGATLEMVIAKLRHKNPEMQVIALSATVGNPGALAGWLDAELVTSEWRPVDLREGVYWQGAVHFEDHTRAVPAVSKDNDLNLCLDTVAEGGQCLVFVNSRRNAEAFAKRAASKLKLSDPTLDAAAERIEQGATTELGRTLARCVKGGAAFHHAGLAAAERREVEDGFRTGAIKVISSTPTLAAGLNLPARRVIVRDYLRFGQNGMARIPVGEYKQMAGRAGRPHLDPYGEAVLIAKRESDSEDLFETYIDALPEEVHSQCNAENALRSHILSLVATGFARSRTEVLGFMETTFYAYEHQGRRSTIQETVERVIDDLIAAEMVDELDEWLEGTEYGTLVSRLYIDPRTAEAVVDALRLRPAYADVGVLELLCETPDMLTLFLRKDDYEVVDRFLAERRDDLWTGVPYGYDDLEGFFQSVKTAMLLLNWAEEVTDEMICERFNVGPGDIHNKVETAVWLIHATSRLAHLFAPDLEKPIAELEIRVKHGIKRELLPLIRLRGIGRVRARRLFNAGLVTPEDLRTAGVGRLTPILGEKTAARVVAQAGGKVDEVPEPESVDDEPLAEGPGEHQTSLSAFGGTENE
ncbi:ATP-dependent DNA helicase [Methanofollis formosanus]|uniref:ATP-dependent DNA helicase Hel308 n=1 Tax=Methanofollis formosanus TaxID=299308 RepID=A0A8G1A2S5_9EURY|nr:ATP-dependent DNA helicase [Methanofollis formosanus]QYZ79383.1 ATP-dependent DNA helicase [Methanofollis formosanus]